MKRSLVFLSVALALGPLGIVAIVENRPYTSTYSFTVPPNESIYVPIHVIQGGRLSGGFTENRSQLVSFYVFNQQQFDGYRVAGATVNLFSTSNVPDGTYAVSIPLPGTYYLVTVHGLGYDQTSEHLTLNVMVDDTNLPYLALESLAPISGGFLVASYSLRNREDRRLVSSLVKASPNFGPGQGEDDDRILNIAKDLRQNLGFKFEPLKLQYVSWVKLGGVRAYPSDQCLLGLKGSLQGYVVLPASLRGKLEPSEWKPLIASSLIHSFQPELRRRQLFVNRLWKSTVATVIAALGILIGFTVFVFPVENPERFLLSQLPFALIPVWILVVFVARKVNLILRKYFLEADTIAAKILGKDLMIQTLKKIDSMNLTDVEERKKEKPTIWKRAGVLPWPSITLRIQQLENRSD